MSRALHMDSLPAEPPGKPISGTNVRGRRGQLEKTGEGAFRNWRAYGGT